MKSLATYCLLVLLVSCNSSEKKNHENSSENKETIEASKEKDNGKAKTDGISLPQHGDYSTLFNLKKGDCDFVSASDIATALSLPENTVTDVSAYGVCKYEISLDDNSKWSITLNWEALSKEQITREIKNYLEEGSPLTAQISKTKDSYLCIHPFNNWLILYNNNYDGAIHISYCPIVDCRKLNKDQKESRKQLALNLGDYLLQKHQK